MSNTPTLELEAALLLARDGDWEGMEALSDRLSKRYDPEEGKLKDRARAAAALLQGGYAPAVGNLQQLLTLGEMDILGVSRGKPVNKKLVLRNITLAVCDLLVDIGDINCLNLIQPCIESADPEVSLAACESAIALFDPGLRKRLMTLRE